MLASLLLCSVHIPHEAPDSRSTFADFASDESVCPRGDYAPVADTIPVADATHVVDTATSGVDTNSGGGTTLVGDAEPTAG
jgi:hypothetical protein